MRLLNAESAEIPPLVTGVTFPPGVISFTLYSELSVKRKSSFTEHRAAMTFRVSVVFIAVFAGLCLAPARAKGQEASESERKVVTKVVPQYPQFLRNMNIQGVVRADLLVAADGRVKSVEVKGGHPVLVQAAESALKQWKWESAPHESHVTVELRFTP